MESEKVIFHQMATKQRKGQKDKRTARRNENRHFSTKKKKIFIYIYIFMYIYTYKYSDILPTDSWKFLIENTKPIIKDVRGEVKM